MSLVSIPFFISSIFCLVKGHRFKVSKKVTKHIKEYSCSCCGLEVCVDPGGKVIVLTPRLKNIHSGLANDILKRRNRKKHSS